MMTTTVDSNVIGAGTAPLITDPVVTIADGFRPTNLGRLALEARQVKCGYVFVREVAVESIIDVAALSSRLGAVEFNDERRGRSVTLFGRDDAAVLAETCNGETTFTVCATAAGLVDDLVRWLRLQCGSDPQRSSPRVRIWHGGRSPGGAVRRLDCPAWAEIASNYPGALRNHLGALMALRRPAGNGRLILWHGEAGTGKTTALRALIREWAGWCAAQFIADPDVYFVDVGYIVETLTVPVRSPGRALDDGAAMAGHWRLLIAEDADEHLLASGAGGGTGRLLNLADGIVGHGSNTLILLTTNEPLSRLNPALVRPGRCLAKLEFSSFPTVEAADWLGDLSVAAAMTLAELYQRRGDLERLGSVDAEIPPGVYL